MQASVSCKITLRSDRVQKARSEEFSFTWNRKWRVPHIVPATTELLPSRLPSISLGTRDDCGKET